MYARRDQSPGDASQHLLHDLLGRVRKSIRPPESVTEPEKIASAAAYDYTGSLATAEYDHLIPWN